ncbi:MAG: GGDEF domain-containing protein, partial [Spirochaetales bacterium]|nr:GGDEF domain-containing protein [Spirochaetales bacterium]
MEETRKIPNLINILLLVSIIFSFGVIVMSASGTGTDYLDLKASPIEEVSDGWAVLSENGDIADFDRFFRRLNTNEISLSRIFVFSDDIEQNTLSFVAYNCSVEVLQDGNLVYSRVFEDEGRFLVVEYDVRCILNVRPNEASEVTVHMKSTSPITVSPFYFGSSEDTVMESIRDNLMIIVLVTIFMTIIVTMAIIGIVGRKKSVLPKPFINFLFFLGVCSMWMLMNVRLLVSFGFSPAMMGIGAYELFMFLPLSLSIFMYSAFNRMRVLDFALFIASFVNLIVMNILHFAGIASLVSTAITTITIIVIGLVILMIQSVDEFLKEKKSLLIVFMVGLVSLVIGSVMELVTYFAEYITRFSPFFILGLLIFNFSQMTLLFRRFFGIINEGRHAGDYLSMAKTDILTGLGNRRALEMYITELANSHQPSIRVGCIVCDLNDLKITNDRYGHAAGDKLIKDFAQCLKECFENRGIPFRTGGDEFYVLFSDVEVDMSALMRRLLIGIEGTGTDSEIRISCSRGCYADYV